MEVNLGIAFVAGVLSFLAPCVVVLIPVFLAGIGGTTVQALASGESSAHRRVIAATLLFALGFTVVFVTFGALSGYFGRELVRFINVLNPIVGGLIVLLGLVQMGVLRLGLLQRTFRLSIGQSPSATWSYAKPFLVGLGFGAGWTPCVGPVLAAILLLAGQSATVGSAVAYLFAYSIGLLVPFLLFAIFAGRMQGWAHWFARHARMIEVVGGIFLVVIGFLIATDTLSQLVSRLYFLVSPRL